MVNSEVPSVITNTCTAGMDQVIHGRHPHPVLTTWGSQGSLVFDGHHSLWALAEMRRSGVWMFDMASDQWLTMKCHR